MESDKIEEFIHRIFFILKSGNMETFTEMSSGMPQAISKILKTYSDMDKNSKKMLRDTLKEMLKISTNIIKDNKNK
jgi:hypothetical protein